MPGRSANSSTPRMPAELIRMPRQSADLGMPQMLGVLRRMPGVLYRMPRQSAFSHSRHMPRHSALARDRAACPAQPGIAADRFAREIVDF
jgi:hypothetical protein